jgi:hypothetical protein
MSADQAPVLLHALIVFGAASVVNPGRSTEASTVERSAEVVAVG